MVLFGIVFQVPVSISTTNPIVTMNPIIEITTALEFDTQLSLPDCVFFLVLGNTPDNQTIAKAAEAMSDRWRYTLWAKDPSVLHSRLLSLPLRPGVLKIVQPWPTHILGVSISVNNYICRVVTTAQGNVIAPAFMLAETYMQP